MSSNPKCFPFIEINKSNLSKLGFIIINVINVYIILKI